MPFCPKCRVEYLDWVKVCSDCGVELVDKLPPLIRVPKPKPIPPEPLVTVATYSHPEEAHLYRAYLESAGIDSVITDENIVTTQRFYSIAVGGVKLQVRESDVEAALSLINNLPGQVHEQTDDSKAESEEHCPKCNSTDIRYEKFNIRPLYIFLFIFGFMFPFFKNKWKCHSCSHEWSPNEQEYP